MVIYHLLMHTIFMCPTDAGVAELADAPDLGSGVPDVQVQVLSPAFLIFNTNKKEVFPLKDFFFVSSIITQYSLTLLLDQFHPAIYL